MKRLFFLLMFSVVVVFIFATLAEAHKPVSVKETSTVINEPEVSRAFYSELTGKPHIYTVNSDKDFKLYVNVLVPQSSNPNGRYSANIYHLKGGKRVLLKKLDAKLKKWTKFYEEFAGDTYLMGPEFEKQVPAGRYEISVFGDDNQGKYVLAIGEKEQFGPQDFLSVFTVLPELKMHFFEVSPLTLIPTPMGIVLVIGIILAILISFIFWKYVRLLIKKLVPASAKNRLIRNIGLPDRIVRFLAGLAFLILAIHFWSILLFVVSSFLFYEAASKWCGFYAAIGRRTCPIE